MARVDMAELKLYRTAIYDNTRWKNFESKADDVYVCTPPKCGTTWTQAIVANLIFSGEDLPKPIMQLCPWVEAMFNPEEDMLRELSEQTHRRVLKSHTAADGVPWFDDAKYIFVARDGRDAFMSMCNHLERFKGLGMANARALDAGIPAMPTYDGDVHAYFASWLADGALFFENVASYWARRPQANLLFVHYNDLKRDLAGEIHRIAEFLEIELSDTQFETVTERCSFEYMRSHPEMVGDMEIMFEGGLKGFLFKGTNGRWHDVLNEDELAAFEERAKEHLPVDAIRWLKDGKAI